MIVSHSEWPIVSARVRICTLHPEVRRTIRIKKSSMNLEMPTICLIDSYRLGSSIVAGFGARYKRYTQPFCQIQSVRFLRRGRTILKVDLRDILDKSGNDRLNVLDGSPWVALP